MHIIITQNDQTEVSEMARFVLRAHSATRSSRTRGGGVGKGRQKHKNMR